MKTPLPSEPAEHTWSKLSIVALRADKGKGMDPHFAKVIRTMKEFAALWPDQAESLLKTCVRCGDDFTGWTGFR